MPRGYPRALATPTITCATPNMASGADQRNRSAALRATSLLRWQLTREKFGRLSLPHARLHVSPHNDTSNHGIVGPLDGGRELAFRRGRQMTDREHQDRKCNGIDNHTSRRDLLAIGGAGLGALLASACADNADGEEFGEIALALGSNNDVKAVATMADLEALYPASPPAATDPQVYVLLGHSAIGDGGGGIFYWSSGDTTPPDGGTIVEPTSGGGRWRRLSPHGYVNVAWFGATPDYTVATNPYQDNSSAFQDALDSLRDSFGTGRLYVPPGRYGFDNPVLLDSTLQGLTVAGPGRNEAADAELINNSNGLPLFKSDNGSTSFVTFEDLSFRAEQGASHLIQSTHGMNFWNLRRIFYYLYEPSASFLFHGALTQNDDAYTVATLILDELVGKSLVDATTPQIDLSCTSGYVISNVHVRNALLLSYGSSTSAPQIQIANYAPSANTSCQFEHVIMEIPTGGGIHLYGLNNVILNSVTDVDSGQNGHIIVRIEKSNSLQGNQTVTLNECRLEGVLEIRNGYGGEWPSLTIIGGFVGTLRNNSGSATVINAKVANYDVNSVEPLRIQNGSISGVRGLSGQNTEPAINLAGVAKFCAGESAINVLFATPESSTQDYNVLLTPQENAKYWINPSAKGPSFFQIKRDSTANDAEVGWMIIRPSSDSITAKTCPP